RRGGHGQHAVVRVAGGSAVRAVRRDTMMYLHDQVLLVQLAARVPFARQTGAEHEGQTGRKSRAVAERGPHDPRDLKLLHTDARQAVSEPRRLVDKLAGIVAKLAGAVFAAGPRIGAKVELGIAICEVAQGDLLR